MSDCAGCVQSPAESKGGGITVAVHFYTAASNVEATSHLPPFPTDGTRRPLGARRRAPPLDERGGGCDSGDYRVDLPLVRALQAGIVQRAAHIVVEHRTVCAADRTRDSRGRHGGHREPVPFFAKVLRSRVGRSRTTPEMRRCMDCDRTTADVTVCRRIFALTTEIFR